MKKIFILLFGIILVALSTFSLRGGDTSLNELLLENVEAMAEPEVDIEAICMGTSGVCITYSHGFFIRGVRMT